MVQVDVLSSGSSGNALVVKTSSTRILLDAGVSCKKLLELFEEKKIDPRSIDAVLITHEHSDHVKGLKSFLKKHGKPVFISHESAEVLGMNGDFRELLVNVSPLKRFEIGNIKVTPFPVPHDAAATYGFVFESAGVKIGYATDLGVPTKEITSHLQGSHCLLIEFNHDLDLLNEGIYPPHIKIRIAGKLGHLSNLQGAKLLSQALSGETRAVFLMHLSKENNTPEYASFAALEIIGERKIFFEVAKALKPSRTWTA